MLPNLKIKISDIAKYGFNPHVSARSAIGDAFWFSWQEVMNVVESSNSNLDIFLTERIAIFLDKKRPKSNILIFFTPTNGRFVLTICSKKDVNFFDVLHSTAKMPGYLEYGQDYLPPIAKPFIYYCGMQIFRVYDVEYPDPESFYISDFGNLFGLTTAPATAEHYEFIRQHPLRYPDHSVVLKIPTTLLKIDKNEIHIQHAFCKCFF